MSIVKRFAVTALMLLILAAPLNAYALQEDIPALNSISFNGAAIDGEFTPEKKEYTITLKDADASPTLKSYELSGSAQLFVNYELDAAKHQTGIIVTLSFEGGSAQYRFAYSNASYNSTSGNNLLADIICANGEVYPKVSKRHTKYRLYIPSDLTELNIRTVTQDINASCSFTEYIKLAADSEPELTLTVTAANGKTKAYSLQVKRLEKTVAEVQSETKQGDLSEIIKAEFFYNRPAFAVVIISSAAGIAVIAALLSLFRRITVKAEDPDETEFFD